MSSEDLDLDLLFDELSKAREAVTPARSPHPPHIDETLEQLRTLHERGDTMALLEAVALCAARDLSMPEWVWRAYLRAYYQVRFFRANSWDAVFGKPHPGKQLARLRARNEKRFPVFNRINEIRQSEFPKPSIDEALFERVGREFGISKTICSELYYEAKDIAGFAH